MAKDYKPAPSKTPAGKPEGKKGSPLLIGLLIGLLFGIALSVGVALSVKKTASAFQEKAPPVPNLPALPPQPTSAPKEEPKKTVEDTNAGSISSETAEQKKGEVDKKDGKDRFTFYDILTEPEKGAKAAEVKPVPDAAPIDSADAKNGGSFAQVGAFQTPEEADNLKAKVALLGIDAMVQKADIPGKGVLYRVRVGPYKNSDDMNHARAELAKNGIKAELVKN